MFPREKPPGKEATRWAPVKITPEFPLFEKKRGPGKISKKGGHGVSPIPGERKNGQKVSL